MIETGARNLKIGTGELNEKEIKKFISQDRSLPLDREPPINPINMSRERSLVRRINETKQNRRPYHEMSQSIRGKKEFRDAKS
jgi:hypothetical protein